MTPVKRRAVWLINPEVGNQLLGANGATVGAGTVPLISYAGPGDMLLLGRPVIEHEACSALGTRGDIILADLGEYMLPEPQALSVAFSRHVKFLSDEAAFRFRSRVDGLPAWSSPVTPLNGSYTTSPFVTLAARA